MAMVGGLLLASCSAPSSVYRRFQPPETSGELQGASSTQLRPALIAATPVSANDFPTNLPPAQAASLIIIDAKTGETIAQRNADHRRAVASTQKLLTAMVVCQSGHLNQRVVIQPEDTLVEPTKLYVKAGEVYTRAQLLNAILVKSANDAAMALARDNAGSIANFSARMNRMARTLGARNSRFQNPHGLTESGQFSTARDMARIAFHANRNNSIRRIVNQPQYVFPGAQGPKILKNTNKLLPRMSACTGMKTGYTKAAGRCLVTSASLGGRQVILVQLGSETKYIFDDAERLMRWGARRRADLGSYATY